MKIIFIGHPGSGKTYAAELLSSKLNIEKVDLDVLLDKSPLNFVSKKLYRKAFKKLLGDKKDWLIDGYHGHKMPDYIWHKADLIIFLDLPRNELKRNVLIRYKAKKTNRDFTHAQHTFTNNIKNFYQIHFLDKSMRKNVSRIKLLVDDSDKFVTLKSSDQLNSFIDNLKP
jgi:adenylate kinase family enzyme